MSIKSQSRSLGRIIRRLTGNHLTVSMRLGKMIVQNKTAAEIIDAFPDVVHYYQFADRYMVHGPKSNLELGRLDKAHLLTQHMIDKLRNSGVIAPKKTIFSVEQAA